MKDEQGHVAEWEPDFQGFYLNNEDITTDVKEWKRKI